MLTTVEGRFHDGKVELSEIPAGVQDAKVFVTFVTANGKIDLAARGMDKNQAASLRAQLQSFAEDWDRPEMDVYDEK